MSTALYDLLNITTLTIDPNASYQPDHHDMANTTATPAMTPTPSEGDPQFGAAGMGNTSMETTNPRLVNGVVNLILMLFNIGGNGLVLFVYHSLFRNTVFNLFVKALASLDLLTALTTMLIDVMMKLRRNDESQFNTSAMCKLSHFQVYANSMASGCVLTLIAYQRYRKICHPLERGMVLRRAKILLLVIGLTCLVISVPTVFLYGSRRVKTLVRSTVVETVICRTNASYQDNPLTLAFYYILMAAFSFVLVATCVLYCLVSRSIRKFENRSSAILNPSSPTSVSSPRGFDDVGGGGGGGGGGYDEEEDEDCDDTSLPSPYRHYGNSPTTSRTVMTSPVHGRNPINPHNNANHQLLHHHLQQQHQHHQHQHHHHNPYHQQHHHHHRDHNPYQNRLNATNHPHPNHPHARANPHAPTAPHRHNGDHNYNNNAAGGNTNPKKKKGDNSASNQQRRMSNFTLAASRNVISTQMYRVFTTITVVYIISYLPHLVALIITKVLSLDDRVLTHGERMALEFAYNCPYISTVSNPIIYGFSSAEFRDRVRELLESCDGLVNSCWCCCCCCCGEGGNGCCNGCCCDDGQLRCCVCCDVFDCCDGCNCEED